MPFSEPITFTVGGPILDRSAHLRQDAMRMMSEPGALSIPFSNGRPLIDLSGPVLRLAWLTGGANWQAQARVFLGMIGSEPRFAVAVNTMQANALTTAPKRKWIDLRSVAGELDAGDATAAATAKALLGWNATHRFCANCGIPTHDEEGGWRRRCPDCNTLHFPRTDPVVIMLITDGKQVLVGRQPAWPEGLYSLLAGFVEPGETIEDAVRREVMEEAGVAVGNVRYLACQPWPFPSNLMIGCIGRALSWQISIDHRELETACWVSRADMLRALAGDHPDFAAPRQYSIARSILSAWTAGQIAEM